jgi:hypothetical protein
MVETQLICIEAATLILLEWIMSDPRMLPLILMILDEDEASDIINDSGFLEALCTDLKKNLSEGTTPDVVKPSDRSSEELRRQVLKLSMNERLSLVDAITDSIRQEFQSHQAQESLSGEHPNYANVSGE